MNDTNAVHKAKVELIMSIQDMNFEQVLSLAEIVFSETNPTLVALKKQKADHDKTLNLSGH